MGLKIFIADGYTRDGTLNLADGQKLQFSYRPATSAEVRNWLWLNQRSPGGSVDAEFIAKHLVTWNAGDKITAEIVASIEDRDLFRRLLDVITGDDKGDGPTEEPPKN